MQKLQMAQTQPLLSRLLDFFAEALRASGRSRSELAAFLGIAPSAISRIFSGERQLSAQELLLISEFLSISLDDVDKAMNNEVNIQNELEVSIGLRPRSDNKIIAVDSGRYTGHVVSFEDGGIDLHIPLSMFGNLDFNPQYLRWLPIRDDSMSPTLQPGDSVVIDASKNVPTWPGLFAVELGGDNLIIRRIDLDSFDSSRNDAMLLSVSPDNDKYKAHILAPGRVVTIGKCLIKITRQL